MDLQSFLTFEVNPKLRIEFLGNIANNKYLVRPVTRQTDFGTVRDALRVTIYFDGQEIRPDQVATILKQAALGRAPAVVIRGDRASALGIFATVYTEAKRSGIQHVQFATARADGP